MRGFILIAIMAVAVHARPEPPRGYNYQAPAPIAAPAPSFNAGYSGAQSGGYSGGQSSFSGGQSSFNGGYQQQQQQQQQHHHHQQSFGQVAPSFNAQPAFQAQAQPQTIVQKHIYVHVPPPEEEYEVAQQQQQFSAPRKHYKIIFIKAPSAPSITQQIAAAQAQSQEKTLIYVLVKKPEDVAAISAGAPAPDLPVSKPEVYFIKYKTQKQEGAAQSFGGAVSSGGNSFSSNNGYSSGGAVSSGITDYVAPAPASQYGPPAHKK